MSYASMRRTLFAERLIWKYACAVPVEVADEAKIHKGGVPGEDILEGGYLGFVKHHDQLIAEVGFYRLELIILKARLLVILDESVLFPGRFPCGDIGGPYPVG